MVWETSRVSTVRADRFTEPVGAEIRYLLAASGATINDNREATNDATMLSATARTQVSVLAGRLTRDLPCPSPVH